ncbi:MAG: ABC transporter permease [Planctomycetaceae bacterium]
MTPSVRNRADASSADRPQDDPPVEFDDDSLDDPVLAAPAPAPARGRPLAPHGAGGAERPVVVIRPTAGNRAINLAELWRARELLFFLAWRDIKVRYKQTVLGVAWAVIQPVLTMVVFTVFFGRVGGLARYTPANIPYQVFVYAALLPWQFFAFALTHGGLSLIQSERLISKVYFPRLLLPCATVGTGLVDFAISCGVLASMMWWYAVAPTINLLLLPVLVAGMVLGALGAATLLASLSVAYRDFRYVIPFMVQVWMLSSPVAYPLNLVGKSLAHRFPDRPALAYLLKLAYALNPMAGIIDGFSSALLGLPFHWDTLAVSLGTATALFVLGLWYFRSVERRFADIV